MGSPDALGILFLIIAAAIGAYLAWFFLLRPGRSSLGGPIVHDRNADTIPPTRRPPAELSPEMVARQLAKSAGAGPAPEPPSTSQARKEGVPQASPSKPPPLPVEPFPRS